MATATEEADGLTEEERLRQEIADLQEQLGNATDAPPPAEDLPPVIGDPSVALSPYDPARYTLPDPPMMDAPPAAPVPQFPRGTRFSDPNNADTGTFTPLGSYSAAEAQAMAERNDQYDSDSLVQAKRMQGQAEFDRLVKAGAAPETAYRQTAHLLNFNNPKELAHGLHEVPAPRASGPAMPESLKAVPVKDPATGRVLGHEIYDSTTGKYHTYQQAHPEQSSTVGEREVLKEQLSTAKKEEEYLKKKAQAADGKQADTDAYRTAKKAREAAEVALKGAYSTPAVDADQGPQLSPELKKKLEQEAIQGRIHIGNNNDRPIVQNPNGSVSTVSSIGVGDERGEWVIPTIVNGKRVSEDEAVNLWRAGKNQPLGGPFKTVQEGEAFAQKFHESEARRIGVDSGSSTKVTTQAQYDALGHRTIYTGKDGKQYRKP